SVQQSVVPADGMCPAAGHRVFEHRLDATDAVERIATMLRVTAYTGGHSVPSARFRVRQYISPLRQYGVDIHERPARFGSYPPHRRALRPIWGALALGERLAAAAVSHHSDVTLLQREMISTLARVERFTKAPRVLDVDDAIWLLRGGHSACTLARLS